MQPTGVLDTAKATNPCKELLKYGQSIWLDYIRRNLITSGELKRLIEDDGVRGMTSNPAIFEKAIVGSTDYTDFLESLNKRPELDAKRRYELLAIRDIQDAAELLKPVYEASNWRDGYVSLEVSPYLARDTQGTIEEARRLWKEVNRPNVMIKVPGTAEGIPAIEQLISDGINVNVTLLFSQDIYEQAAVAYIAGLEKRSKSGGDLRHMASVASFFISRIDTLVDSMLSDKMKNSNGTDQALLKSLQGKVAIANGKLAYQRYLRLFNGPRWEALSKKGAQTQRVLWASTSTKNPAYRDVIYIEELIGKDTVNTVPPNTLEAFRDHGKLRESLTEDIAGAQKTMDDLARAGISIKAVTDKLTDDAIGLFSDPFDKLLTAIEKASKHEITPKVTKQEYQLPQDLQHAVQTAAQDWQNSGKVKRLYQRDASVWTGKDEANWLGWLDITQEQIAQREALKALGEEVKKAGFRHVLLLGMGGSSLAPEVLALTFGIADGYPELHVLDSTDPDQVRTREHQIELDKTLFIVASKSGSTLEPNIFKQYFFERAKQVLGDKAGSHFIAVTDPGSQMEQVAQHDKFRHVFHGRPSIGGRYSALSNFGMVPAAVMGLDVAKFIDRADQMVHACAGTVPVDQNPGVMLGLVLGAAAKQGRDKVTFITSPGISDLGAWLEQLIAESTGKEGKGIIPVDREKLDSAQVYGNDRLFAYIRLEKESDSAVDDQLKALAQAGHPVVRIVVGDKYDLGQEFFRWEIATAVAGSIIGINPFNQPDVEASKVETRKLTSQYEKTGSLPSEQPILDVDGVRLFADAKNAEALSKAVGSDKSLGGYLRAHLSRISQDDYFAILAYIEMNERHEASLQSTRLAVRDAKKVATCLGFGPRFLHSTGQAYKGGPNSGVFLQVTCDHASDLPVPGQKYTFGVVEAAQARGDFQVLAERGRRALRVHLADVGKGLATLQQAIAKAIR